MEKRIILQYMKYMILSFLMLLTQAVSAQTIRDSQNQSDSLSIGEIFYLGEQNDAQKATIKIKTNETTTQRHDGNDVFKTNRVVEYSIKKTSANIVIIRKIISTVDTPLSTETTIKKLFPNVTSKLLSGILKPGKRNIAEWEAQENTMLHIKQERPCCISHRQVSFGWRKHRRKKHGNDNEVQQHDRNTSMQRKERTALS